ncbi:hypothetical protein EON79_04505 [bacterium]|nr:MAG: hypothetical protein EON79_04505 [bacterium]
MGNRFEAIMDILLTRRQALQSLATAAAFSSGGISLITLAGCGGGGNGGEGQSEPVATTKVTVPVEFPSGFSLPISELEAGTAFGSGAIKDGAFSAVVNPQSPTFAYVLHKPTGKVVMTALVGADRPGLTPLGNAAAAMALLLGIAGLPGKDLAAGLALLEADPSVKGLGESIASAMATDPYAITAEGGAVATAIKTAFTTLAGAPSRSASRKGPRRDATRGPAPQIEVTPSTEQGGFEVNQGDPGAIVPTNLKRRPAAAITYRVGHDPGAGAGDQTAAVRVGESFLTPTTSLAGSLVSLGNLPAWAPVAGRPVDLTIPGNDKKTFYETVVLMAAPDTAAEPAFLSEARYEGELLLWRQTRQNLNEYAFYYNTCADVFKALAGASTVFPVLEAGLKISADFTRVWSGAQTALLTVRGGGLYNGLVQLLRAMTTGSAEASRLAGVVLRIVGLEALTGAELAAATAAAASLAAFTLTAVLAVGTLLLAGDAAASYADYYYSPAAVRWQETALKADLTISPETVEIAPGGEATLTADVVGRPAPSGTMYTWKIVGGSDLATLSDPTTGKAGRTIETKSSTIKVVTTPSTQGEIVVTVEALLNDDLLGPAKSTVKIGSGPYILNSFVVDDNLTVWLNGKVVFADAGGEYAGSRGPFILTEAKAGSVLRIQVRDYYGLYAGTSDITLTQPGGKSILLVPAFQIQTPGGNRDIVLDKSFTI